ncbi:MAG: polyribonucleotide nucleotidyltransferase [Caldisericum sp. CG2_30_36_11]|nr:MAG: polyribonucleotide nucleotidyltransferase [Caldisericum sp. CG2_30_36_11]
MMEKIELEIGGKLVSFEIGRVAKQAGGAVLATCGDTQMLATSTMDKEPVERSDFFPLTVDYFEKMYAAGKIPGGFFKREGRPSENEILGSRLIDRPLRPLFPVQFRRPVQIVVYVLSSDGEISPEILGINAASLASLLSDEPFTEAVGAVKVGLLDSKFVINPSEKEIEEKSALSLSIAGTKDALLMIEAGAKEVSESQMIDAMGLALEEIRKIAIVQEEFASRFGKPKVAVPEIIVDEAVKNEIEPVLLDKIKLALQNKEKLTRERALEDIKEEIIAEYSEKYQDKINDVSFIFDYVLRNYARQQTLTGARLDGRARAEIRPISIEVGVLKRTHGSALFTRGQTQVLSIVTLAGKGQGQLIESLDEESITKRYMHYYNFPPFSVGEVKPMRGPSRREIGHGALAERALVPVLPSEEKFPYTMRVVSEVLESNGSTSMASTCGSTLALMDAGVPITKPVAGIAMGLIKEGDQYVVLTDIQGAEDHLGDMDFKVTGTTDGITALQMDIKIKGIDLDILGKALDQAKDARLELLEKMLAVIPKPRDTISPYAPRIFTLQIKTDKIGLIIGPGGRTIKSIIGDTDSEINIEPDGKVYIAASSEELGRDIKQKILGLVAEPEVGKIYHGVVVDVRDFGALVQILPNYVGLLHVSQISDKFVKDIRKEVRTGDKFDVKVMKVEDDGKIQLTRKFANNDSQKKE